MNAAFLLYVATLDATAIIVPRGEFADAYLDAPAPEATDHDVEEVQLAVHFALDDAGVWTRGVNVLVEEDGRWLPLSALLPHVPPSRRPRELTATSGPALVGLSGLGTATGALTGKTVYVSQAHGLTWNDTLGRWATQRGLTHDIVEDFVNTEAMNHYLIPMLQRAGALVFPVREPDRTASMVVVDDAEASLTGTWTVDGEGFGELPPTLKGSTNPFSLGTTRSAATVSALPTATAAFVPALPNDGHYGVHVAWEQGSDRAADAVVAIHHAGGIATFRVDQRRHGSTWVYLGRFPFRVATAKVVITNASSAPGARVSIDAVRFGGGVGLVERGDGAPPAAGPTSGRARWEECSRYHSQFCGAPASVYNASGSDPNDDVGNRSRYAAWQHEEGEDAVFVSWHSNAPSPARGTSTWVYGPNEPNGDYDFTGTEGSDALAESVHGEIMGLIKSEWDPAWKDRGVLSAWFGELNPNHNPEMPATLVEVAFHSTAEDAAYLADPRFRDTLARGFLRGIIRYFAERDGVAPVYPPAAPRHLRVTGQPGGELLLRWAVAEGSVGSYRVYAGRDGFGFDRVGETTETELVLSSLAGAGPIAHGDRVYVYVTAVGPGGESAPTPTLGARSACLGAPERVLIVHGFERLDALILPREELDAFDLGSPRRLDADRVNTFAYAVEHGESWAAAGFAFDAVEASALAGGAFSESELAEYAALDWILGEESTKDETFSEGEQALVHAALDAGAKVIASGAEIGWDLDVKGSDADRAFLHDRFKVAYESDDAGTTTLSDGSSFSQDPSEPVLPGRAAYPVEFPDVFKALAGGTVLATYSTGGAAVVVSEGTAIAGFPLETLPGEARDDLVADLADALALTPVPLSCAVPPVDAQPADVGVDEPDTTTPEAEPGDTLVTPEPESDAQGAPEDASMPTPGDAAVGADIVPVSGERAVTRVGASFSEPGGCDAGRSGAMSWALWCLAAALLRRRRAA